MQIRKKGHEIKNLILETAKADVAVEAIAETLEIYRNSASNKINGKVNLLLNRFLKLKQCFLNT